MQIETWLSIIGYENLYDVSNLGRIRNARNGKVRVLTPNKLGYPTICLTKAKCKARLFRVHRLVAIAFIPNPENKPHINHIDGNSSNSNVNNLEWCTHVENMEHAKHMGLFKGKKGSSNNRAIMTEDMVLKSGILREQKMSYIKIAYILLQEFNVKISPQAINNALLGKNWSHLKLKNFRVYEEENKRNRIPIK